MCTVIKYYTFLNDKNRLSVQAFVDHLRAFNFKTNSTTQLNIYEIVDKARGKPPPIKSVFEL